MSFSSALSPTRDVGTFVVHKQDVSTVCSNASPNDGFFFFLGSRPGRITWSPPMIMMSEDSLPDSRQTSTSAKPADGCALRSESTGLAEDPQPQAAVIPR